MEAQLYAVMARRLPGTTIMSIGHPSAAVALHQRHLEMTPEAGLFTLRDAAKAVAAGPQRYSASAGLSPAANVAFDVAFASALDGRTKS